MRFSLVVGDSPGVSAVWHSEGGDPPPARASPVDDRLSAAAAVRRASAGEYLLYSGDYRNARQLLAAMGRRLGRRTSRRGGTPLEVFRSERAAREREHRVLSRLLVALDESYRLQNQRAPDVGDACRLAWGEAEGMTVVSLRTLLGIIGAAEWYRKGIELPGLQGRIHPRYGVFLPTRSECVELLLDAPPPEGKRVFDVGAGSGVLSFILLQRGARSAVATDIDPRAVMSAREDAQRLGLAERFEAVECDLFPPGRADLIVCNPPWIPELPKSRLDRAVFDPKNKFLEAFLTGLSEHLERSGEAYLFLSNLAELLGLRSTHYLPALFDRCALDLRWTKSVPARHPRAADASDPLHQVRSKEVTFLYCLAPRP